MPVHGLHPHTAWRMEFRLRVEGWWPPWDSVLKFAAAGRDSACMLAGGIPEFSTVLESILRILTSSHIWTIFRPTARVQLI